MWVFNYCFWHVSEYACVGSYTTVSTIKYKRLNIFRSIFCPSTEGYCTGTVHHTSVFRFECNGSFLIRQSVPAKIVTCITHVRGKHAEYRVKCSVCRIYGARNTAKTARLTSVPKAANCQRTVSFSVISKPGKLPYKYPFIECIRFDSSKSWNQTQGGTTAPIYESTSLQKAMQYSCIVENTAVLYTSGILQ